MASTLRNWITPTVAEELFRACDVLQSQYTPGQHLKKDHYICNETLSIHLTKGKRVQVIEILDRSQGSNQFDVVLSDATTRIHARLISTSTAEHRTIRDLETSILGAIIGIVDYHLIYNPTYPPASRLVLRATEFKLIGCLGEKPFGKPIDIERQESLYRVLSRIDNLLSNNRFEPDEEPDMHSQAGNMDGQESEPRFMTSQAIFATQVPLQAFAPKISSLNKGADLLSLLNGSKSGAKTTVNAQSVLQPVTKSRKAEMSSRLESKTNCQSSITSSASENTAPPHLAQNIIPDDDSEKENSQESLDKKRVSVAATPGTEPTHLTEVQQLEHHGSIFDSTPEGNPFDDMERIPRSYVSIPRNQQALLDQKDSWYRPDVGGRSTYAKIPADVLQDLNAHAHRVQPDREPDGNREREPETVESNDSVDESTVADEDADVYEDQLGDLVGNMGDPGEAAHLREESGSSSDDESTTSWSESEHGDIEPENIEPAPRFTSLDDHPDEAAEIENATAISATDPHPEHSSSSAPSVVTLPPKLKPRYDYNFPSSSAGDDEELEMAVPHAIDDEILVANQEITEEPEKSQELPSTAVQHKPMVQVEQTPDQNSREVREPGNGKLPEPKLHPLSFPGVKNTGDGISSDPFIPATFRDTSSQDQFSAAKKPRSSGLNKSVQEATSSAGHMLYTFEDTDEEDERADGQIVAEVDCSQHRPKQFAESTPIQFPSSQADKSPIMTGLETLDMVRSISPPSRSLPHQGSSSFHTALSEIRNENKRPSAVDVSPSRADIPEHEWKSPGYEVLKFKPSLDASVSQGEWKDTAELVRAARHEFNAGWSSQVEEQPIVQIARSQQESETAERPLTTRDLAKDILPQSSNDLVMSSAIVIIEPNTDMKGTAEEMIDAENLLRLRKSPLRLENSSPPMTKPSGVEKSQISSDRITGRTGMFHSEAGLRDALDNSMEEKLPNEVEIMSIFSESESDSEQELEDENLADESAFAGELVSTDEDQKCANENIIEERYSSPELNKQTSPSKDDSVNEEDIVREQEYLTKDPSTDRMATHREQLRSPEPTAFERFNSVYPSYSGREKNFVWALVYIEWLGENKGDDFLRASLWDDFIRSLSDEYLEYMKEVKKAQLPRDQIKTGFAYFNKLDKAPIFRNRVITPDNVQECLLSLDGEQAQNFRSIFSQSTYSLAEPPRPESSHGTPSIASNSQAGIQQKSFASSPLDVSGPADVNVVSEPVLKTGPAPATMKRPFFETPSQLQSAARNRSLNSPNLQHTNIEPLSTSKKRQSLPWPRQSSPASVTRVRPAISPLTSSSWMRVITANAREERRVTSSASFNGSPASPILGEPERASRSFSAIDNRSNWNDLTKSKKFPSRTTSAPRPSSHQESASPRSSGKSKVEGWLHQGPIHVNAHLPTRKESVKRKRESGLELLDMQSVGSSSGAKRPKSATAHTPSPVPPTSNTEVREKPSFRDFLKKRRESGIASSVGSASSTKKKLALEPETQAWTG